MEASKHGNSDSDLDDSWKSRRRRCSALKVSMSMKPGTLLIPRYDYLRSMQMRSMLQPAQLKLRFMNSPPPSIFTSSKIEAEDGSPIAIELLDAATYKRVSLDLQVRIVPLDANFTEESLTTEEFSRRILRPRQGKRPLLIGDLTVSLKDGFGVLSGHVVVTDNSSWLWSGKFRLGARVIEGGVLPAISEAFVCKDEFVPGAYTKHYPPYPDSELWRRDIIAKNGVTESRLAQIGIRTVKDLRRYLSIHSNALPPILQGKISENRWNAIVSHSMHCVLDHSDCYVYNSQAHGASLLFDSAYQVIKVSFDGFTSLGNTHLTSPQQALLDELKREAYDNINTFVPLNNASFPPRSQDAELSIGLPGSPSKSVAEVPPFIDLGALSESYDCEPLSAWVESSTSKDYDVVIRYGRVDIGNDDFISHLHAALCRRGISVYEEFNELVAVPQCRVLIILLTSTYVPSNLINILEHQRTEYQAVYPIFYGQSPSDLISNRTNYESIFPQDEPKRWQAALKELTQMPGYTLTDRSESDLIDEIVRDAVEVLSSSNKVNIVGMGIQLEQILSLLSTESSDVRSIGIWGTVGIGKTAIAEEIFRRISVQYETCVFLKDLHKEVEVKGQDAVREEFLAKLLEVEPDVVRTSDIKTSFLRSRLQRKRVLVILDDVNDFRDVETFLGKLSCFGAGSRIIITSRNRRVFVLCKIIHVYEVKPLDISMSPLLLNRGTSQSVLSHELVKFSNGNPQVLKFLSRSRSDIEWNQLLQKVQNVSPIYIPGIFERICCGLDDNERSIFLDIACFFRRMDKKNLAMLLDGCGFSAHVGFKSLVDKSLLTMSQDMVDMLRFVQTTGREIVRRESADRPGERSRLWNTEDIRDIFINDTGTSAIEGIFLDMSMLKFDANPNLFEKMCNLRLLKFFYSEVIEKCGVSFPQGLEYLPSKLRLLHWEYFPLSSLPRSFDPKYLVELNLPSSCVKKLWKGKKSLENLKKMKLSYSYQLTKLPRFSSAPNLEHIDLEGCNSIVSISQSISSLKKLVYLNLKDCSKLESLPSTVELDSLEVLNLSGCSKLENFPEISPNVKELYMGGTIIQGIPSSIKNLVLLEKLNLENSRHLENLPNSICKLKHLKSLNLSGCSRLERFPDLSRRMKSLKSLDLSRTAIKELPSAVSHLTAEWTSPWLNASADTMSSESTLATNESVALAGRPRFFVPTGYRKT